MARDDFRHLIERLDARVARALEDAAAGAGRRGHEEVGVEHLLVALLDAGSGEALIGQLDGLGVDVVRLRDTVDARVRALPATTGGRPVFGDGLMRWLERAVLTATLHHHAATVTPAAMIDALAALGPRLVGGEAYRDLADLDVERLRRLAAPATAVQADAVGDEALARFTLDFTARAAEDALDPVLGRSAEIREVIDALCRRSKNNPLLVGEPGVGKTALVEGLAQRIHAGEVPPPLRGVRLLGLDLGLLQAGASVKGEFEQRLQDVIDAVRGSDVPVILFIDEAHMLIGAGGEAGGSDAANLLKPALARGELRTIAATTWSEYKRYFEKDAALARRFQLIAVEEPEPEAARRMLSAQRERLEAHHGVSITEAAVDAAVTLSARYVAGRQLPDKAVDLLDTAAARVCLGRAAPPHALDTVRETEHYLAERCRRAEQETRSGVFEVSDDPDALAARLAELRERGEHIDDQWRRERDLSERVTADGDRTARQDLAEAHRDGGYVHPEVDATVVAGVVADWTGVPLGRMLEGDIDAALALEVRLGERVVGQDAALARIGRGVRAAKAGLRRDNAPVGVYLLTGPSGVGKTETARLLAERLYGSERALVTINMSEYQEAHSVAQLKGAPPGYVGYGEGGVLTEAVRRRPYSVVLLDEIDKAHRDVLDLFYQIFDQGMARDGEGRAIDFRNTLIVMTSNLGATTLSALAEPVAAGEDESDGSDEAPARPDPVAAIRDELQRHFGAALIARAEVVPFMPLDAEALAGVVALKLDALATRLDDAHGLRLECTPAVADSLASQCQASSLGARLVDGLIEQQLLPGLARELLHFRAANDMPDVARLELDEDGQLTCVFADIAPETAPAAGAAT